MADADITALREDLARSLAGGQWGEAAAVAVLLGFQPIAGHERFGRYVDRGGVDWTAMLKDRAWSTQERFLIATAAGLWSGRDPKADISRVPFLSDGFYETWLAMVTASRTGKVQDNG
jgi:hypothetical protein